MKVYIKFMDRENTANIPEELQQNTKLVDEIIATLLISIKHEIVADIIKDEYLDIYKKLEKIDEVYRNIQDSENNIEITIQK